MNFLEKLDYLMEMRQINKHILAKESGIPYTTIDAFYKKGYHNTKLSTVKKICEYFDVSLDYMMKDERDIAPSIVYTDTEKKLFFSFKKLNKTGREKVIEYTIDLLNNTNYLLAQDNTSIDHDIENELLSYQNQLEKESLLSSKEVNVNPTTKHAR